MKIVVAGAGKIGSTIAEALIKEGHEVTLIDNNREIVSHISDEMDVICIEGSAADPDILSTAGVPTSDLVVAATEKDEVNMICAVASRKLGARNVIARIRDPEYINSRDFIRDAFGINLIVNPELECAREISRVLRFPGTARIDAFSKGNVEIALLKVENGDRLAGLKLCELPKAFGSKVLVSAVERGKDVFIPNGGFELKTGDRLSVTGAAKELRKFFTATGYYKKPVKNVMIMGGSKIAVYLSGILQESGIKVTIIERDRARCDVLGESLPEVEIIYGDATRSEVLFEEGINSADAFVALSGDDGNNIITSMFVSSCPVEKIVTKVSHRQYPKVIESSGLDCIIAPQDTVAQELARYVRAMGNSRNGSMETLYKLADGKAEAIEFVVGDSAKCIGVPLRELKLKPNIIVAAIIRGRNTLVPNGDAVLKSGDHAIISALAGEIENIDDILA